MTGFRRTSVTWLAYAMMAIQGFSVNGLGSVLLPLREETGLSQVLAGFYASFFAIGLLLTGVLGSRVIQVVGRKRLLRIVLVVAAVGAAVMTIGTIPTTLLGAAAIGFAAALLLQILPADLAELHGPATPAALAEANAAGSIAGVLAPVAVAAALGAGLGWQAGYSIPLAIAALVAFVAVVIIHRRASAASGGVTAEPVRTEPSGESVWGPWFDLVASVSVEFCFIIWGATAIVAWHGSDVTSATLLAGAFLLGMGTGRITAAPVIARWGAGPITAACLALATLGAAWFWAAPTAWLASAGLLIAGLGVSLLYPLMLGRLIAADPEHTDRATSRGALASGTAILIAPPLLAWLADMVGMRIAFLLAPVLLAATLAHVLLVARRTAARR